MNKFTYVSKYKNLRLKEFAVDAECTADRKSTCFSGAVVALGNQMLIFFVIADYQRDRDSLDEGGFQKAKLLDNVLLEILGDSEIFVVPGLALVYEGTVRESSLGRLLGVGVGSDL